MFCGCACPCGYLLCVADAVCLPGSCGLPCTARHLVEIFPPQRTPVTGAFHALTVPWLCMRDGVCFAATHAHVDACCVWLTSVYLPLWRALSVARNTSFEFSRSKTVAWSLPRALWCEPTGSSFVVRNAHGCLSSVIGLVSRVAVRFKIFTSLVSEEQRAPLSPKSRCF